MKTIEQNNIMIAEFMGYIDNGCSEEGFLINPITKYDEDIESLEYHSSWDWLMPVVEKIEGFEDENRCAKNNFNCVQSFFEIIYNETSE
jgi:hypothetical protein